jgi:hypothetical protein
MGQETQVFSISYADLQGKQGSAINYDQVIVALPAAANTKFAGYGLLAGAIPHDPKDVTHAARYCVKATDNAREKVLAEPSDKEFDLCTGDPNCNGGPEPKSAVKRFMKRVVAKLKHVLRIAAKPPFGPGSCQVQLKDSVTWSTGGLACLSDKDTGKGGRILVCASTDLTSLPGQLKDFCNASGLAIDTVAFHIYEVSLPRALISGAPNAISSPRQLLAVPVRRGNNSVPQIAPLTTAVAG